MKFRTKDYTRKNIKKISNESTERQKILDSLKRKRDRKKRSVEEFIREMLRYNPWIGGYVDFTEGDPFAGLEKQEMYSGYTRVRSLKKLYQLVRSYDGVFVYKDLVLVSDHNYGVFIYKMDDPRNYVEHIDQNIPFREFRLTIRGLLIKDENNS